MVNRVLSEVIAPLQAGLLAVISLTVKDVDIVLAIVIKIATIISIIFVCAYHYAKTKRINKLNKLEDEKNIE